MSDQKERDFVFEISRDVTVKQYGLVKIKAKSPEEAREILKQDKLTVFDVEWYDISIPVSPKNLRPYY